MARKQLGPAPANTTDAVTKAYADGLSTGGTPPAASETVAGVVELATIAEAQAGTDTTRAVTPAGLAASQTAQDDNFNMMIASRAEEGHTHTGEDISPATEISSGVVELATTAEATTGTDTTRAVTPAGLKAHVDARGFSTGGGGAPGGTTEGGLQYKSGTTFAGSSTTTINGGFLQQQVSSTPGAPAAGNIKLWARDTAAREMLAVVDANGYDYTLQPFLGRNRINFSSAIGGSTTVSNIGMNLTGTGTATAATGAVTNAYTASQKVEYLATTAATTAVAGIYSPTANWFRGGGVTDFGGFFVVLRWGHATGVTNANHVFFAGMSASVAAPTSVQPSTLLNTIGVGYDSTTANYSFIQNNASGTATMTSTGIAVPTADRTTVCELVLTAPRSWTTVYALFRNLTTQTEATASLNTKLPATNTMLAPRVFQAAGGTSSVTGIAHMSMYIETDN